jgi:CAAX protease family protein
VTSNNHPDHRTIDHRTIDHRTIDHRTVDRRTVEVWGLGPGAAVPAGVSYPLVLRGRGQARWRSALGVVLAISLFLLAIQLVSAIVIGIGYALERPGISLQTYSDQALRFERPIGMLAQNLAIATLIPISWFLITVLHQVPPRWLSSVRPGLRRRYLGYCLLAAIVVLDSLAIAVALTDPSITFRPQPQLVGFLLVVVLTSPLQAAAEEYLFRGYLLQAFGSFAATPWVGIIASSVLFAAFHGGQNLPLFVNRLAFGLLAAILVWRTGGLEAGIAAHVINNISAYGLAALTGSIAALRSITAIGWTSSLIDIVGFALFATVAIGIARRSRLDNLTPSLERP